MCCCFVLLTPSWRGRACVRPCACDQAISTLTVYQTMARPDDASVCVITYGALQCLEDILSLSVGTPAGNTIKSKLQSAGPDILRYILDHRLVPNLQP